MFLLTGYMLEAVAVAVPVCDVAKFFSSSDSSDIVLFELTDLFFFNLKEVRLNTEPSLTVLPTFELSLKDVLLDNVSISSFGDIPGELNVLEFTLRGVHGDIVFVFVFVFVLGAELGAELVFVFADGNGLTFEIKGEKLAESSSSESDDCLCIKFVFILAEEVVTVLLELDKSTLETELELEFVYELQVVPDSESELCVDVSTESELP